MSVSAFAEILELAVVATTGRDLLHVIDSPIRLVGSCRDLIGTVPMVARSSHASIRSLVIEALLTVAHSHAVHMLRLALASHHGTHRM